MADERVSILDLEPEEDIDDLAFDDYVPKMDVNSEAYRRYRFQKEQKERAKARAQGYAAGLRGAFAGTDPKSFRVERPEFEAVPREVQPGTYSASYTQIEPINNVPEVIAKGSDGGYLVTARAKAIKNAESTPVTKTVSAMKKKIAASQVVTAGADRVRAIQHESFCSDMKREAVKKIAKFISQLPPKQQVIYEGRLQRLTNWRKNAKQGKAGTPKEFDAVNLKALMRFSFLLEKKALWYASVDLRRASRHTSKCAKVFRGQKRKNKKTA